jgi:hypothetical protein
VGAAGATGANGPAGPAFTNVYSVDPLTRSSGYTIPNTDTYHVYFLNNSGGAATITLPLAATLKGKMVVVQATTFNPASQITIQRQGSDQIEIHQVVPGNLVTSIVLNYAGEFISDGTTWLLLATH